MGVDKPRTNTIGLEVDKPEFKSVLLRVVLFLP